MFNTVGKRIDKVRLMVLVEGERLLKSDVRGVVSILSCYF